MAGGKTKVVPEGTRAVLSIDPGRTTGVAAGYVELRPTLKETLATIRRKRALEVSGDYLKQGAELATLIRRFVFRANVEQAVPIDDISIVFEDFVLRRRREGGATGDLTSAWVAAATMGAAATCPVDGTVMVGSLAEMVTWQQPSSAKSLATNDRLKLWGLYEVGSEHKRDAWRHLALRVNYLVG